MKGKKVIISVLIIMIVITIIGFTGCKHHKSTTPVADLIQSHLDQVGETYRLYPTSSLSAWEGCYEYYEFIEPNINMQYHVDIYQNDSSYYADVEILGFQTDKKLLCTVVGDENRINIIFTETAKPEMYNAFKPGDILLAFQHNDTGLETEWIGLTPLQLNANANDYFKQVSDKAEDGVTKKDLNTVIAYEITSLDENILSVKFTGYSMIQDDDLVVEYGGLKAFSSKERSSFLESILSGKDSYTMRQVYIENEKLYFIVDSLSHALGDYSIIRLNTKK